MEDGEVVAGRGPGFGELELVVALDDLAGGGHHDGGVEEVVAVAGGGADDGVEVKVAAGGSDLALRRREAVGVERLWWSASK